MYCIRIIYPYAAGVKVDTRGSESAHVPDEELDYGLSSLARCRERLNLRFTCYPRAHRPHIVVK